MGALTDSFGRTLRNVRISITDRCNMRCTYCMPRNPIWIPHREILTFEEILRLVGIFVGLGVEKLRVTGGEPTVRRGVVDLIRGLHEVNGLKDISLTTNGWMMGELAQPLRDAGLRRLNISLDTLDPRRFQEITRTDALDRVLEGLAASRRAGFDPIKVNFVAVRGVNDDEVVRVAEFGRKEGYEVRYIEFMPLDAQGGWDRSRVLAKAEILREIGETFPWEPAPAADPHAPAERFRYKDGQGSFGVIGSVTEPFCGQCDRIRLTADGKLRTCLFSVKETDLKAALRSGTADSGMQDLIRQAVWGKEPGHLIDRAGFERPERTMHRIGG